MRIRLPFAGAFVFLLFVAAYLGLTPLQTSHLLNDKVLHALTFFILTTAFYWILDTTRRRTLNISLITCTGILAVGSEFLQAVLPNGRAFDAFDIAANVAGSAASLALSSWYHKRMLERRRQAKTYTIVPGDDERDLELGDELGAQESGIVDAATAPATSSIEHELDNWNENAPDEWDEEEPTTGTDTTEGEGGKTPSASSAGEGEPAASVVKKRAD